jgi:hypothetical protein
MGTYSSNLSEQTIITTYGFYDINYLGRYILIGINAIANIPYITLVIGTYLRSKRTGSLTISMKIQLMVCILCFLLGVCSFFPKHVPSSHATESEGDLVNVEYIKKAVNTTSCRIEATIRISALVFNSVICLLNTIYNLLMYSRPEKIERSYVFYNFFLFFIPFILFVLSFIICFAFSEPKIGLFGFCKFRLIEIPEIVLLTITLIGWFSCFVIQAIFICIVKSSHKKASNDEDSDPRLLLLAKKMEFRAYCCLFDYLLLFVCGVASYNHTTYNEPLIWAFEIVAQLLWPTHVIIFGFIGTDLMAEIGQYCSCLNLQKPNIEQTQEQVNELMGRASFVDDNEDL